MVPHLVTANPGPILELERRILDATADIERWFRLQWQDHTPPFYASTDLRNAGFKLAPVDLNLFPGGFNNLSETMLPLAVQAAQIAVERFCCEAHNLLLIPERHTRNTFYLQNVARLVTILRQTGLNVRLGSLSETITEPTRVELPDGSHLVLEPLVRHGRRLGLADFDPCSIVLNNDLSAGTPEILKNLHEQHLLPPLHAGWTVRRKSLHARAYDRVANDFARLLGVDPWLLNPLHTRCGSIDFHERTGEEALAESVDSVLAKVRAKYAEHGIAEEPFVIVKADAGTYGMGVMSVKSPDDVRALNRKTRNKMSVVKEGLQVNEVIVQEGVRTIERVPVAGNADAVAEPVVYMIDRHVVGGFYRVHGERGVEENLNAPGMQFVPLPEVTEPMSGGCNLPDCSKAPGIAPENRFYMYGVVARLALLGASLELEMTDPERAGTERAAMSVSA
ncbi:MAG TPA: glutamate--cysteine ligase [Burkholderiaceae bacterium]|nr:glutamate--cysteine ligase [Burkholderiaceae bacterium]